LRLKWSVHQGWTIRSFHCTPISVSVQFNIPGYGPQILSGETNLSFFRQTLLPNGNMLYSIRSDEILSPPGSAMNCRSARASASPARPHQSVKPVHHASAVRRLPRCTQYCRHLAGELPAGLVVGSASGHDYRMDPTVISVREPASAAMFLAGLGIMSATALRRRSRRSGWPRSDS
jgi:hypothetical protein